MPVLRPAAPGRCETGAVRKSSDFATVEQIWAQSLLNREEKMNDLAGSKVLLADACYSGRFADGFQRAGRGDRRLGPVVRRACIFIP